MRNIHDIVGIVLLGIKIIRYSLRFQKPPGFPRRRYSPSPRLCPKTYTQLSAYPSRAVVAPLLGLVLVEFGLPVAAAADATLNR